MKTKLEMAHDYLIKLIEVAPDESTRSGLVSTAWNYADLMQAEAYKRDKEEASQKRKAIREMINADNTFLEKEGQHFDDVEEWQPDWSQAPNNAMYWAMDGCGQCNWYEREPEVCGSQWDWGGVIEQADTGYDYQGDWRESLRKRPQ